MSPAIFISLVLTGAVLLVIALTVGPKNSTVLGVLLALGVLLLLGPLGWVVVSQLRS